VLDICHSISSDNTSESPFLAENDAAMKKGLTQVLEASVSGLLPKQAYVLALAAQPDGRGSIEPLAAFTTNPAGSAIVNRGTDPSDCRER
jgi:hypothetical protein